MEKHYSKIIYALIGAVVGLVIFIYTTGVGSQKENIIEAKNIAVSASEAGQDNTESIIALQGQYKLLEAKLDWIISALKTNGIKGNLPIPTSENINSKFEVSKL